MFAYREAYKNEPADKDDDQEELPGGYMPNSSSSDEESGSGDEQWLAWHPT